MAWSALWIDLAHREPVAALHAHKRRDDRQPRPGPVHSRGTGTGACQQPLPHPERHGAAPTRLLRPEQRAPSGVGVKDLRPLRGRPFGPILDPDASPRRAQEQAENSKKKDHPAKQRVDRPRSFRDDYSKRPNWESAIRENCTDAGYDEDCLKIVYTFRNGKTGKSIGDPGTGYVDEGYKDCTATVK